ncbi:MAG: RIP metalloprotease RseP [FCB group bacterium]|nr:RIP metalloprotease RseP [FCB group bacterium]
MTTLISFIFILGVLVFVHELGHFLAAKSVGMKVEKFYLGFNLFGLGIKKQIGETEYGIGLFPLGGYVKVAGIIDESMDDSSTNEPYEYQSKNFFQQIFFASAGVIMNLLLATVIFTGITMVMGVGEADPKPIVGQVIPDYPAEELGLQEGDVITAINGIAVSSWEEMTEIVHNLPNTDIQVSWKSGAEVFTDSVRTIASKMPVENGIEELGMIGIGPRVIIHDAGFIQAIQEGLFKTGYWLQITFSSVKMIFTGQAAFSEIGGPVMIAKLAGESARAGLLTLFNFMAIISVNLALLNILPIPGLDGGHIIVSIIEGVSRRKLPTRVKLGILQVGMLFLLAVFALVMFNDIARLF